MLAAKINVTVFLVWNYSLERVHDSREVSNGEIGVCAKSDREDRTGRFTDRGVERLPFFVGSPEHASPKIELPAS